MTGIRIVVGLISALVVPAILSTPLQAVAAEPEATCSASKRKAAGKKSNAKLKCVAKAASADLPVDPLCMTKAEAKFDASFAKAEAKGGCVTVGDAGTVEASVDACVVQIRTQLGIAGDPSAKSRCSSAKLKATGKRVAAKLGCFAKAAVKDLPVDPACLTKAETKVTTGFAKAEIKADCYTTGDSAPVGTIADDCVDDVVDALPSELTCDAEPGAFAGITAQHNMTRANAIPVPSPALDPMCWNDSLAATAQAWADNCDWSHDPMLGTLKQGQNLYAVGSSVGFPPDPTLDAEPAWAAEAADYDYPSNSCSGVCGHYTQIVWRDTTFVGCGIKQCTTDSPFGPGFPNWTIVACNYKRAGNVIGQQPY